MVNNSRDSFVSSLSFNLHPMKTAKKNTRAHYYAVLEIFLKQFGSNKEFVALRKTQYYTMLMQNESVPFINKLNSNKLISSLINNVVKPWMWKYRYLLVVDLALILVDKFEIERAVTYMQKHLSKRQATSINMLLTILYNDDVIPKKMRCAEVLIEQFRDNRRFFEQYDKRILITANMSAGKSTLLNALIGKKLARTSQEACTASLSYFQNKPYEDETIHLLSRQLKLDATVEDLNAIRKQDSSQLATHFHFSYKASPPIRLTLIDSPGVNSAINREHGQLTKQALKSEQYDHIIYVLNANQLGTDDEIRYLKYVAEHVPKQKIVFVLNKLDTFKGADDSIAASIDGVHRDLLQLGFENPIVCPISAYFALLLKLKQNNEPMSEDEQEEYEFYVKKFSRPGYDLSLYTDKQRITGQSVDDGLGFAAKCGIYSLEKILYGGN